MKIRTRDWSDEPLIRAREEDADLTRPPIGIWILAGVLALLWRGRDHLIERYRSRRAAR